MRVKTKSHSGGLRQRSNKRYPPSQAGGSALQALATWLPRHARKPNAGLSPTVSYLAALHLAPIDRPRGISVLSGLHWGSKLWRELDTRQAECSGARQWETGSPASARLPLDGICGLLAAS